MRRREFLSLAAGSLAAGLTPAAARAQAQGWPTKPVKLIVPETVIDTVFVADE